jgi:hypothetical protein
MRPMKLLTEYLSVVLDAGLRHRNRSGRLR